MLDQDGEKSVGIVSVDCKAEVFGQQIVEIQKIAAVLQNPKIKREDDRPRKCKSDEESREDYRKLCSDWGFKSISCFQLCFQDLIRILLVTDYPATPEPPTS